MDTGTTLADQMRECCPFPEPIRSKDMQNAASSGSEK